jgi:branched-chain amino acid transport system substrate-binding protein
MAKPIRAVALVAVAALGLAACSGSSSGAGGASDGTTLIISSDLPLQGDSKDTSEATNNAIKLYLSQIGNKAGRFTVKFQPYDDATSATGEADDGKCRQNAAAHVANPSEVAVVGPYNSGCAKIIVPILGRDPRGPMLLVSHANTNPGLTKAWEPDEPGKFYPNGGRRNYARVVTTDDVQGPAAADFAAKQLGVRTVYILNDDQTYGRGVAKQFETSAKAAGMTVLGNDVWDGGAADYTALFQKVKATHPDLVFLAGVFDSNGAQLVKDKYAVLGDNATVKLMAPDGFTGYKQFNTLAQAQGAYLTFPGLSTDQLRDKGGPGVRLLDAYRAKYNADPPSSYALYAVAAVQVIVAAIKASDGTRAGVDKAVFSGTGITVPAEESVLGQELKIDPATGDVNIKDITVETVKGEKESFLKAISVA